MGYRVVIKPRAVKAIRRIARQDQPRVLRIIDALADNPRPPGVTKLAGGMGWRIRVGDYRVVYAIDGVVKVVSVENVGHRRDIYRRIR